MNGKPPVLRSLDEKFDSDRLKLETEFTQVKVRGCLKSPVVGIKSSIFP